MCYGLAEIGILVLADGEATRLPGKLLRPAGDRPMLARVVANMTRAIERAVRPEIFISAKATFPPELDRLLTAPIVINRYDRRGPLGGMLTAFPQMQARFVFVVAGDAPFVDGTVIERLRAAYMNGDEAFVPSRASTSDATRSEIEPLAAIYDRLAFVREGLPILRAGRGSIHLVLDRLKTRYVPIAEDRFFANINTLDEYATTFSPPDDSTAP